MDLKRNTYYENLFPIKFSLKTNTEMAINILVALPRLALSYCEVSRVSSSHL